jgi:hypothetical protein
MSKYGPGGTKPAELDAIGKQILESNKAPADIWAGKEDVVEDTLQFVKPEGHSIAAILLINRSEARVKVELDLVEKEQ